MKPKSQHSPAPWHTPGIVFKPMHYGKGRSSWHMPATYRALGIGNGTVHIAYVSVTEIVTEEEARANARLIVAAPELLAALQDMLTCNHELGAISKPVADQARAAIRKAIVKSGAEVGRKGKWEDVCRECYYDIVSTCQLCGDEDIMPSDVSPFILVKWELGGTDNRPPGIYKIISRPFLSIPMIGSGSLHGRDVLLESSGWLTLRPEPRYRNTHSNSEFIFAGKVPQPDKDGLGPCICPNSCTKRPPGRWN